MPALAYGMLGTLSLNYLKKDQGAEKSLRADRNPEPKLFKKDQGASAGLRDARNPEPRPHKKNQITIQESCED